MKRPREEVVATELSVAVPPTEPDRRRRSNGFLHHDGPSDQSHGVETDASRSETCSPDRAINRDASVLSQGGSTTSDTSYERSYNWTSSPPTTGRSTVHSPPESLSSPKYGHTTLAPTESSSSFLMALGSGTSSRFASGQAGSGSSYNGSFSQRSGEAVGQPRVPPPLQEEANRWLSRRRSGEDVGLDFDDFEVVSCIGTGTFGRVLLVKLLRQQETLPTFCALKVLVKSEILRQGQTEHSNWERAILAGIQHHGIVNLICTFQDERNVYLLLEFVQGGELFSHLRRAVRFTPDVARFYAANCVLIFEYLHSRQVVYRDLKPENLLLGTSGYLKLCDMGFAKLVPDRTFTLCGTPHFLSPETIRGTGHGTAADWWSLGILLFEMLCGYPPFYHSNPLVIYEKILAGHVAYPPYVDPLAKDLIKRLLTADLSRRLGNLRRGSQDVREHGWFVGVDWDALGRQEIMPPIIPHFNDPADTSHFDRYPPTVLRDLPALERAHLKRTLGPAYHSGEPPLADPFRRYFEAFG